MRTSTLALYLGTYGTLLSIMMLIWAIQSSSEFAYLHLILQPVLIIINIIVVIKTLVLRKKYPEV